MKKIIFVLVLFLLCGSSFGSNVELSKQATAFYSDNNHTKTMDLILQINENDRTSQDWLLLGNVLADNGKIEDAVFMYRKAIVVDKKCYKAYYNLGNYYMDKGNFSEAANYYAKASKYKSDNPYIYYNLGCAYLKMKDFAKAKSSLNKSLLYSTNIPEVHYNLAYVYKQLGKDKLAQTYMDNYNKLVSGL